MECVIATFIQAWRKRQSEQQAKRWSEERNKAKRAVEEVRPRSAQTSGA
jgi:hypothetical protein